MYFFQLLHQMPFLFFPETGQAEDSGIYENYAVLV